MNSFSERKKAILEEIGLDRCRLGNTYCNKLLTMDQYFSGINTLVKDGMTVLDAGAGEGKHLEVFKGKQIKYIGVDSCVGHKDWDYGTVIKGDLYDLHFLDDNSVDVIMLNQVLEHLSEPGLVLKELNRVLKFEGYLFIGVPQGQPVHQVPNDFYRFTPYGLVDILSKCGFKVLAINPQLYGDIEANGQRLTWALIKNQYSGGILNFAYSKVLIFFLRLLKKSFKRLDLLSDRHVDPIGYFVKSQKL